MISVLQEKVACLLVLFGVGGAAADALADRAARLAPLTGSDADELIRSIRAAPLLLGRPGAPGADLAALRDLLQRVSQMADDLPQIAELELSPVFARPDGVQAVDARIRLQAAEAADAHLRRLSLTARPSTRAEIPDRVSRAPSSARTAGLGEQMRRLSTSRDPGSYG